MTAMTMDYPAAWEFVRSTELSSHDDRCSWVTANEALLCDCHVLWTEYRRRQGERIAKLESELAECRKAHEILDELGE